MTWFSLGWAIRRRRFCKRSSDVAEDYRVVIANASNNDVGLPWAGREREIGAARRSELVLSNIGDRVGEAEEESLHGNDVLGSDSAGGIHISSQQLASRQESSGQELLLHADHIDVVDVAGG